MCIYEGIEGNVCGCVHALYACLRYMSAGTDLLLGVHAHVCPSLCVHKVEVTGLTALACEAELFIV